METRDRVLLAPGKHGRRSGARGVSREVMGGGVCQRKLEMGGGLSEKAGGRGGR